MISAICVLASRADIHVSSSQFLLSFNLFHVPVFRLDLLYLFKQVLELSRKEPSVPFNARINDLRSEGSVRTLDGESLPGACLPVGEESTVVSLDARVHNRLPEAIKDLFLSDRLPSNEVEGELLLVLKHDSL